MIRISQVLLAIACFVLNACVTVPSTSSPPKETVALQYSRLASAYIERGELETALQNLKKALDADSASYEANLLLAIVYEKLENDELADKYYSRAISLVNADSHELGAVHNNYASFLCRRAKFDEAFDEFNLALKNKLYRTPEFVFENMGICSLAKSDNNSAESFFMKAIRIRPALPRSLWELARLNYNNKQFLKSRAFLQRLLELERPNVERLVLGIRIEKYLGDKVLFERYARELKEQFPDAIKDQNISELLSSN